MANLQCDVLIVGGGTGGCAAAQALAVTGLRVIMTEPTDWIGGQFTSQMVPPDEHPWIETHGSSARYREFRGAIREHYRMHESLTLPARRMRFLNPGNGWVSRLCHSPQVAVHVLEESLRATRATGRLQVLLKNVPVAAQVDGDRVTAVGFKDTESGQENWVEARLILEASEVGDLLPLADIEYRIGAESRNETGEPHAVDGPAEPDNVQSFTWVIAVAWEGETPEPPAPKEYEKWTAFTPPDWPYPQVQWNYYDRREGTSREFGVEGDPGFNLFTYRQVTDPALFSDNRPAVTLLNWPQNDYQAGGIVDVSDEERKTNEEGARQLSLSVLHWLRTEGGYPNLRPAPEYSGTTDGLAKAPYIREGRRIKARTTILEMDCATDCNPGADRGKVYDDRIGIGAYRIDLHPGAGGQMGLDISSLPFHIPLGALLPERVTNVIAAGKCLGTTHITNGCYRLHPVEWVIGEVAGLLAAWCLANDLTPHQVYEDADRLAEFQEHVRREGVETDWPTLRPL